MLSRLGRIFFMSEKK
jgi:hypothetical protein